MVGSYASGLQAAALNRRVPTLALFASGTYADAMLPESSIITTRLVGGWAVSCGTWDTAYWAPALPASSSAATQVATAMAWIELGRCILDLQSLCRGRRTALSSTRNRIR